MREGRPHAWQQINNPESKWREAELPLTKSKRSSEVFSLYSKNAPEIPQKCIIYQWLMAPHNKMHGML